MAPFTARDGLGQLWHLPAGSQTVGPGLRLKTTDFPQPQRVPGPVTFLPGSSPLRLGGRPYRGNFQVSVAGGALRAVNNVALEAYLYGVVPSEMPKDWLPEALKAQAVAARSYALAVRKTGSWFDLYPDTRSQVYLGIAHESPSTTAAVQATAGEVVLSQGRLATTYFFSSSGGRTASAPEIWPTSQPTPYLVSVDDPYDTLSPHHRWGPFVVTASRLRGVMRARGKLADLRMDTGPSGRVESVTAVGEQGESTVTGSDLRRALKLRSTWFRIGVLSLAKPEAPVTYGKKISLSGVARSLPSVRLDQRQAGSTWQLGRAGLSGPGWCRGDLGEASRPDRLPAHEWPRQEHGRPRLGRATGALPGNARCGEASRVRASRLPRRERRAAALQRKQLADGRPGDDRRERQLRGNAGSRPGRLPGSTRAGTGIRPGREPDA